ncbi:MAG TPA: ThiF family adenylyltransferase, partial [Nitrososphaerales archaeon]|nr:ThiF family adenylyltransferase [Nitrososphaerales archaeon]
PLIKVTAFPEKLTSENALETIKDYDVVVDATDNLPSRYLVSDACVLLGKPDVYASVLGFDGQATVFAPSGPCYRCLFPQPPPPGEVKSCEDFGVLGVVPGILGGLQANQAIGLLVGRGSPLIGRLLVFNATDTSFDEVAIKKNPACPACGKNRTITKLVDYEKFCGTKTEPGEFDITVGELKASLDRGDEVVLVDVREPYEYSICHLQGSKLVPLAEVPARKDELSKDKAMVVYCHVGVRSTSAVAYLRKEGFRNARNLRGGIDAWATDVDPKMPRY